MQPNPNPPTGPGFGQVVIGTMVGNLGCAVVYLLFIFCIFAAFGTAILSRLGNIYPQIPTIVP